MPPLLRQKALRERLDFKVTSMVRLNRENFPGVPFLITTEQDLLSCALACDVVRGQMRAMGETVMGVYLMKRTSWSRVNDADILVLTKPDGTKVLNPAVFGEKNVVRPMVAPPPVVKVEF